VIGLPLEELIRMSDVTQEDRQKESFLLTRLKTQVPVTISTSAITLFVQDKLEKAIVVFCRNDTETNDIAKEIKAVNFQEMWFNKKRRKIFGDFCTKELSAENFMFMEEVEVYRNMHSAKDRLKKRKEIIENFLGEDAKYMINISGDTRHKELQFIKDGTAQPDLFNYLMGVVQNMVFIDTYYVSC
jgi:hypothetical protein